MTQFMERRRSALWGFEDSPETSATVSHVVAEFMASVCVAENAGLETKDSQGFLWLRIDTRVTVHSSGQDSSA